MEDFSYIREIKRLLDVVDSCNVSSGNYCPTCRDAYKMIKTLSSMAYDDQKELQEKIKEANKE